MNVFTYRRVSTNLDNGFSLAAQADKLTIAANQQHLRIIEDFLDISSGMSRGREGLAQLLDSLATGEARGMLVTSIDRISRSLRDCITIMQTLIELDCRLFTQDGEVDMGKYIAEGPVWLIAPRNLIAA